MGLEARQEWGGEGETEKASGRWMEQWLFNLGLSDAKIHAFSIFANRRIHLEKSYREAQEMGMRRGKKLDKIEAAMTLRSGLSLEGVIGSKTARRERSVWGETGDCGSRVLFFCSTARVFFRRVRWV